jgi:anti-sigma B factor antagonist
MTPAEFRWTLSPERALVRVCLEGELDLSTAATFHDAVAELMEDGWTSIVVDLAGLTFMDSSGLRATFELDTEATRRGIALRLTGATDQIQRLFAMTGLSRQLDMAPGTNGHRTDGYRPGTVPGN